MRYIFENRTQAFTAAPISNLSPLPHIHPHLELIYLTEGESTATADNKEYLFQKGDLYLSFPNQIHFYHVKSSVKGYMFIFSPDLFKDFRDLFNSQVPVSQVIRRELFPMDAESHIRKITEKQLSSSSYDNIAAKGYLLALLSEILPLMTFQPISSDQDSIKTLLQFCSDHYTEPLSLDSVSRELHLNKYYISHIFKERMNIGFNEFINGMRVEHARDLLKKGVSITDVAFSSGFSSIRTFNRVFAENTNMTPREYVKSKKKL